MTEAEIIERIMKLTGDWVATFALLDRHPIHPKAEVTIETVQQKLPPTPARKVKAGTIKEQVYEAVESFPGSTAIEITDLIGLDKDGRSLVSTHCKKLAEKKVLVRSKNEKGCYVYRTTSQER